MFWLECESVEGREAAWVGKGGRERLEWWKEAKIVRRGVITPSCLLVPAPKQDD